MRTATPIAALLLVTATGVAAQTPASPPMAMPQPICTAPAPLPAAFASFAHPAPAAEAGGVFLGQAARLDLGPGTHFAVPPGHVPKGGTFGGTAGFDVVRPGTYRVAIGTAVWVDVVKDGAAVRSTAHEMGPACSTVRKLVDFALVPGHYTLQFSGSTATSVVFQVAKAP